MASFIPMWLSLMLGIMMPGVSMRYTSGELFTRTLVNTDRVTPGVPPTELARPEQHSRQFYTAS